MAIQIINNGETGLTVRNKLNANFAELNGVPEETVFTNISGAASVDFDDNILIKRTVIGDITSLSFTGGNEGKTYSLMLQVDSTGNHGFEYNYQQVKTEEGVELFLPTEPNSLHIFQVELLFNGQYFVSPIYNIETPAREYSIPAGLGTVTSTVVTNDPVISITV